MKRQLLRALLIVVLLCGAVLLAQPTAAWALDGKGTADEPYRISSAADLQAFAGLVNDTENPDLDACAELTENITADNQWTPIGSYKNKYTGTFNGNDKTISGLYISKENAEQNYCAGLFGAVGKGGTVKNLTLANSTVTVGASDCTVGASDCTVGGICGYNEGGRIEECSVSGSTVTVGTSDCTVGGICGYNEGGRIEECSVSDSIVSGSGVGGICGYNNGSIEGCQNSINISSTVEDGNIGGICGQNAGSIEGCDNSGEVTVTVGSYAGGICGYSSDGKIEECSISGCENRGDVTGSGGKHVGGICGYSSGCKIERCNNSGAVSGGGVNVGGICGAIQNDHDNASISGCENSGDVSGGSNVGGICGAIQNGAENASISNCENSGAVSGSTVGGICGKILNDGENASISNCENIASGIVTGSGNVGGICGQNAGGSIKNSSNLSVNLSGSNVGSICGYNNGSIEGCQNSINISSTVEGGNIGGICGQNAGSINNCGNSGTVTGGSYAGGICGQNDTGGSISNCQNIAAGSVTGSGNVGGICGLNNGSISYCYWLNGTAGAGNGSANHVEQKNADEFASGEVAWMLNQEQEDGPWRQTLGEGKDDLPTLDSTHEIVYRTAFYANTGKEEDNSYQYANSGGDVSMPQTPDYRGYTFGGWYASADFTGEPATTITASDTGDKEYWAKWTAVPSGPSTYQIVLDSDITGGTVTASPRWAARGDTVYLTVTADEGYELSTLSVSDRNGNAITLDNEGGGVYSFTMPIGRVTVTATFDKAVITLPFTDVNANDWFYDPVCFVYENGLMTGTSATTFEPNTSLSRAMLVAVLHRLEGSPAASGSDFSDVASGDWYAEAVNWAASVGVVNGFDDGSFQPNAAITREQMAAILRNYAQYKGMDVTTSGDLSTYSDAASVSDWAQESVQWAVGQGLIHGMTVDTLEPQGLSTRAQVATVLMNAGSLLGGF